MKTSEVNGGTSGVCQLFQPAIREVEAKFNEQQEELEKLRREVQDLRFERDLYRDHLAQSLRGDLQPLSDEERAAADRDGYTLDAFLEELRLRTERSA